MSENPDGQRLKGLKVEGQGMTLRHFVNSSGSWCVLVGPASCNDYSQPMRVEGLGE